MASQWYPKGVKHVFDGDITAGLDACDKKVALVESTHSYDVTDEIIGDVSPIAATSPILTTPGTSIASNVVKVTSDVTTFTSVPAGAACNKVVIYWESGVAGTRYVLCCDDLASAVTPNGNNINLTWGANGIATATT